MTCSKSYIVCSTGGQVKIFDKNLHLIQIVKGVKYVYKCLISPNEKKLLLVSIANFFYIVELDTFRITKHMIRGKYSDNLEGRGCWLLSGNGCCFGVCSKQEVKSALRIYDDIQKDRYRELLCDKYFLTSILAIPKRNTYLLVGYDDTSDKNYLIWYNGKIFEEFLVQESDKIGLVQHVKYDENDDCCIVIGSDGTVICRPDGTTINKLVLPQTDKKTSSFVDVFKRVDFEDEKRKEVLDLMEQLSLKNLFIPDMVIDVSYLNNGKYLCAATLNGVLCINTETNKLEAAKDYPYGVKNIETVDEDLLLITTWDSVELLRLVRD